MKTRIQSFLEIMCDAILITIAVLSVPCSVLTAYDLEFPLGTMIIAAIGIGIVLSTWMHVERFGMISGAVYFAVLVPLLIINRKAVLYGFRLFRYTMLDLLAPDVPFLSSPEPVELIEGLKATPTEAIGWFALLVMALLGLSVAWSLIRSKMIVLPVIVPLPMFMLALIYTDLPLAHWTVFLLMVYIGACLITGSLRAHEAERYGIVALCVLVGLVILGILIRVISPPEKYDPISFERRQEIMNQQAQEIYDDMISALKNRVKRSEDLTDEERWERTDDSIMEVLSENGGEFYLRAYSFGSYGKNRWTNGAEYGGSWKSMSALGSNAVQNREFISIKAEQAEMKYVPYGFVTDNPEQTRESFIPANGNNQYEWQFSRGIPTAGYISEEETAYYEWASKQYVIEDEKTKEELLAFAKANGLVSSDNPYETAKRVAAFVHSVAEYTTVPGKIPEGTDFVLYFLTEGKKGYCVHFATATTALLQAMDIPARYVFGYRFTAGANTVTEVTDKAAHAWTEVYCPGIGWLPIESTAGDDDRLAEPSPSQIPTPQPTETPTPEPPDDSDDGSENYPTETPEELTENETSAPEPTEEPGEDGDDHEEPGEDGDDHGEDHKEETDSNDGENGGTGKKKHLEWLLLLLLPPAVVAGFWFAGKKIRERRQNLFGQEDAKQAVLEMYRYLGKLKKFGAKTGSRAYELAKEAAFSNHLMTEERKEMKNIVIKAENDLKKQPKWKVFLLRRILFLL